MEKPGYQTTEWWTTLTSQVLALLVVLHVLTARDASTLQDSITTIIGAAFLLFSNAWIVVRYIQGRVHLKSLTLPPVDDERKNENKGPGSSSLQTGITSFWPVAIAAILFPWLMASPALAQSPNVKRTAILPWRQQMMNNHQNHEGRLQKLEAQPHPIVPAPSPTPPKAPQTDPALLEILKALLNSLQQPKQQQPIILYAPPLQQLPIQGAPLQQLPIHGSPLQQLPIQGAPKQDLPIPGTPKQDLPAPGTPKQTLPHSGNPQQGLPAAPTSPGDTKPQPTAPGEAKPQPTGIQRYTKTSVIYRRK
jgi:hypothetical protein